MCLAVPGKIIQIEEDASIVRMATIDFQGTRVEASLAMTPDANMGDWVLVHAGFAIAQLDEQEAIDTFDALREALGNDADDSPDESSGEDES